MPVFRIKSEFWGDREYLPLPQFFQTQPQTLFTGGEILVDAKDLGREFSLKGLTGTLEEYEYLERPESGEAAGPDLSAHFSRHCENLPPDERRQYAESLIFAELMQLNTPENGLRRFVARAVAGLQDAQLAECAATSRNIALRLHEFICELKVRHTRRVFFDGLASGGIVCRPFFRLPERIGTKGICLAPGSLYEAEEQLNARERELIEAIIELPNLRWWHLNGAGEDSFFLNGHIRHYPGLIVATQNGNFALVECGSIADLQLGDAAAELGAAWQAATAEKHLYCRVSRNSEDPLPGGVRLREFLLMLRAL